jgi:chemotaxis signal transduction protein
LSSIESADAAVALSSAERMRAEFDRSFAEPLKRAAAGARDFVLIAAGGTQWALALEGLCGIEHGRALVPVPSSRASLLGIAGVSSTAVPVFDLAALANGVRSQAAAGVGRTPVFAMVEAGDGEDGPGHRVGVAFERLLQFARVSPEALLRPAHGVARPTLQFEDELYTIVEAEELLRQILPGAGASTGSASQRSQTAVGGSEEEAQSSNEQARGLQEQAHHGDTTK